MNSGRLTGIVRAIRRRFPGTRVLLEPYRSPDGDPHVRWWLHVIHVPARWRYQAQDFAILKGSELYGPGRLPYFSCVHGPRESAATIASWKEKMKRYWEWRSARVAAARKRRLRVERRRAGRVATPSRRRSRGGRRD